VTPDETRLLGRTLAAIAGRIDSLADTEREHLRAVPVRRAADAFDTYHGLLDANFVSADVAAVDGEARAAGGVEWVRTYWQLVGLHFLARSLQAPSRLILPRRILQRQLVEFERIIESLGGQPPDEPLADRFFLLDLALAREAAISFEKLMGVVMRFDEQDQQFTPGTWMFAHLHTRKYGLETLVEIMPTVIEFFHANSELQGCAGAGWLVDPEVAKVSPHLGWYRDALEKMGATFVKRENSPATVRLATSTSETRREAVRAGTFQPQSYMWILPRDALLQWAT